MQTTDMTPGQTGMADASLLEVRDLHTHFYTDAGIVKAVNGVTLSVRESETLAIVGESGSGKSVTGLTIMGLLARTTARVVGGTIMFRDRNRVPRDILQLNEGQMQAVRGKEIAMIFQDPMSSLNPVFTIGEQIAESIRCHLGNNRKEAMATAVELLDQVGISDPERQVSAYPHELSGGMRQRVMIALALACNPRLLIADEPTTALDVTIQAQIIVLLKKVQQERRMAMIFVTHDLKLVGEVADRVAVMYASQVVEEGSMQDVLNRPRHPYTKALISCIPKQDYSIPGGRILNPIPGTLPNPLDPPDGCRFHPRCTYAVEACRAGEVPLEPVGEDHMVACRRWKELEA